MALLDQIFGSPNANYAHQRQEHEERVSAGAALAPLEDLLSQKSHILQVKLEVLAAEISERFRLRVKNLERIAEDKDTAVRMMERLTRDSLYRLREHKEKQPFYSILFGLEKNIREEEVECWRDVVEVMRDLLVVWEAHEQAQARSAFMQSAGG